MSVRPVDLGGFMQNQHNYSTIKHSEDQKPVLEQHFAHSEVDKKTERNLHQVHDKGGSEKDKLHYDAKNGSNNKYKGNPNKREKKSEETGEDSKYKGFSTSSFDISI